MTGFGEIGQNGRFWAKTVIFLPFLGHFRTLMKLQLCARNKSYERILRSSSDGRTDESEFIVTKSASQGTKKGPTEEPLQYTFFFIRN